MRLIDADELMEHAWRDKLDSRELIAKMIKQAPTVKEIPTKIPIDIFEKLVSQEPCDVPDINDGNIYKCPCGYEWDKSKVVRHHFCPNCGRTVNSSYNSIKPELKSCEDAISRQAVLDAMYELCDTGETLKENPWRDNPHIDAVVDTIERLPSVNPRPQPKTGQWIEYDHGLDAKYYQCSICKGFDCGTKGKYCKWCGTKMVEPQESEVEE